MGIGGVRFCGQYSVYPACLLSKNLCTSKSTYDVRACLGIWPTKTPLGYRNITGPTGKKIIAADPALSPIVAWLFEWYARRHFAEGDTQDTRGRSFL
jgi:hypothetical protein